MFDDIPEDREESYPCPNGDGGGVYMHIEGENEVWECDTCNFKRYILLKK